MTWFVDLTSSDDLCWVGSLLRWNVAVKICRIWGLTKQRPHMAVICFASSVLGGHRNQLLEQHLLGSHWVTIVRNCTTGWQLKTIYLTAYSIWCWLQLVISHCSSFFDCSWLKHQASYNALWWPLGICVFQADAWTNLHVFWEIMIWKFYQLKMTYVYVHIFWLIIL